MKHILRTTLLTLGLCSSGSATASASDCSTNLPADKQLVIIIDDLGNNLTRGKAALALPGHLTYAIIPRTRYAKQLAEKANELAKEVMLHAPMSNLDNVPPGPGGLTPALSKKEFRNILRQNLDAIPYVRGVNNHMGSDLTQRRKQMAWVMQELRLQNLYFVDSRTSDKTLAATVAAEFHVPHLSRQVFLDNERSIDAIAAQFEKVLEKAETEGLGVAIGHPYPETISFLETALPTLQGRAVRLVFVSEALTDGIDQANDCLIDSVKK